MSVPVALAGFVHSISVLSRSGRAAREIARVDIDEDGRDLDAIAHDAAARVYRPRDEPEGHADLAEAIGGALSACEAIPGNDVTTESALPDGRRARVRRTIES